MFLEKVQTLIDVYPNMAALWLIIAKIVGAIVLFPGTPLTLLAGATFGLWKGLIISIIGNTIGAICAFLLGRYFFRDYVTKRFLTKYKRIEEYEKQFFSHGLKTIIVLRLIPLFPFNVLNYLLGVTRVSTKDYMIGTVVGLIPGTFVFVYFGESIRMLSIWHILFSIVALICLIYIGKYYEKK